MVVAWRFIDVPTGAFEMGQSAQMVAQLTTLAPFIGHSPERFADELLAHRRQVSGFKLACTPVTHGQYQEFIQGGGYADHRLFRALIQDVGGRVTEMVASFVDASGLPGPSTWHHGEYPQGLENHPVNGVSFYEAAACAIFFASRLPSEVEWEYAARYPDGRLFAWGDSLPARDLARFREQDGVGTSAVGDHLQGVSALGLHDLGGNVHEWTSSLYEAYPGGRQRYHFGAAKGARVTRGGAFDGELWDLRTTSRFAVNPTCRFAGLGFRLAQ